MKGANIHNIYKKNDSTLMILQRRLKATLDRPGMEIIQQHGQLPPVECYSEQLNQLLMNILFNWIDPIEGSLLNGYKTNQPQTDV
ncbi:hypothetical protein [Trichormus azollae]|uniref:hypothetical protein n=1 Tax=Trichormus azollae TaxID=1164 RepID=UPI00325E3A79